MSKEQIVLNASLFFLSVTLGFGLGSELFNPEKSTEFSSFPDIKVNSSNNIQTVEFDNNSLDLMFESRERARAYIDLDRDGSFDLEINLTSDGKQRQTSQVVTFGQQSYNLYFRYMDRKEKQGEAYLRLFQIRQL